MTVRTSRSLSAALIIAAFLLCGAAERPDGATLYQKHCSACHPDGSKLKLDEPLVESLRQPFPGMPLFGKDRLSDSEVDAIASYLLNSPSAATPPAAQPPALPKTGPGPQPPAKPRKPSKEKKAWMKGFGTAD